MIEEVNCPIVLCKFVLAKWYIVGAEKDKFYICTWSLYCIVIILYLSVRYGGTERNGERERETYMFVCRQSAEYTHTFTRIDTTKYKYQYYNMYNMYAVYDIK